MRGDDQQQSHMFSLLVAREAPSHGSSTAHDPADRGLNTHSTFAWGAMRCMPGGPPPIAPEKLLRGQLLQMLSSIRTERFPMPRRLHSCARSDIVRSLTFARAGDNVLHMRNLAGANPERIESAPEAQTAPEVTYSLSLTMNQGKHNALNITLSGACQRAVDKN